MLKTQKKEVKLGKKLKGKNLSENDSVILKEKLGKIESKMKYDYSEKDKTLHLRTKEMIDSSMIKIIKFDKILKLMDSFEKEIDETKDKLIMENNEVQFELKESEIFKEICKNKNTVKLIKNREKTKKSKNAKSSNNVKKRAKTKLKEGVFCDNFSLNLEYAKKYLNDGEFRISDKNDNKYLRKRTIFILKSILNSLSIGMFRGSIIAEDFRMANVRLNRKYLDKIKEIDDDKMIGCDWVKELNIAEDQLDGYKELINIIN